MMDAQRYLVLLELCRYCLSQPRQTQILSRYTSTNSGNILKLVWKHLWTYKVCKNPDTSFLMLLLIQPMSEQIVVLQEFTLAMENSFGNPSGM
jgi:hypothetical protein